MRKSRNNTLIVGDTGYDVSKAYAEGALAMRRGIPWDCNPHRDGTQSNLDWDYGHVNESDNVHRLANGVDIITAKRTATVYRLQPPAKNDAGCLVEPVPPEQLRRTDGHHWLEILDEEGRVLDQVVLRWQPFAKHWRPAHTAERASFVDAKGWRYLAPCELPFKLALAA